ncbi:MAG: galactose mutarotase, partial [Clostridiales bacterium]|nr:galactose mutarotase [Clostridiales bacterium]
MKTDTKLFGKTNRGEDVYEYTIINERDTKLSIISYGAAIRSLSLKDGRDIILGYDTMEDYEVQDKYMGAIAGRCANRISEGRFELNEREYFLAVNDGPNHLHGGKVGFDKRLWRGGFKDGSLEFTLFSENMEEGYPGNLNIRVKYTLTDYDEVFIDYFAVSDTDTVVNLTNHSYFNLNGGGTIENHRMTIYADEFTEIDENGCSNGKIAKVEGTPLDFRTAKEIGLDIDKDCVQLKNAGGYDHNFILKKNHSMEVKKAAEAEADGIKLEVWTDQCGMHFYSGNYLDGVVKGKGGASYEKRYGFALETQDWPDAVNHRNFPSAVLKRGEEYRRRTIFK